LADGTLATLGGHVGRVYDDESVDFSEWSFHRGLYGKTPKGYLAGKLTFRIVPGVSAVDGTWRWVKHAGAAPVAPYPSFAINGTVIGAKYHPPTTGPAISGLSNAFHNSWLRFDGPGLGAGSTLNRVATWTSTNQLIYYGPEAVTLSFRAASGALSGTYRDATGLNLKFSGAVIQGQTKELVIGAYQAAGLSGGFQVEPR
jgi:hypothetical protein